MRLTPDIRKQAHFSIRIALMIRRIERKHGVTLSDDEYRELAYRNVLDDPLERRMIWCRFGGSLMVERYEGETGEQIRYLGESNRLK